MTTKSIFYVALLAMGSIAGMAKADPPVTCPQPELEPFCGNWRITFVNVDLPAAHMQDYQGFAIRRKTNDIVLFPRGTLKLLWGNQRELEYIDADGSVPACLTTVVKPHPKPDGSGDQGHVLRFLERTPGTDGDTGEVFRRLTVCMEDGEDNASDCVCSVPHGQDGYHGGYSHAED